MTFARSFFTKRSDNAHGGGGAGAAVVIVVIAAALGGCRSLGETLRIRIESSL